MEIVTRIGGESFVIGVISSLIASGIAWYFSRRYEAFRWSSKLSRFEGEYDGYEFSEGDKLKTAPSSAARLSYKHNNILTIELTHDGGRRTWRGDIFMETENRGSIVWRYIDRPDEYEFGFKRCIFESDNVYLVGEQTEGYGKEILKKKAS